MKNKAFVSVQIIQVCLSLVIGIGLEFDLSKKATLLVSIVLNKIPSFH